MRLNQVNKLRELINYEYTHLYNTVRHPSMGRQAHLPPRRKQIKEEATGADPAEYGVRVRNDDGTTKTWKFSSYEKCVLEAEARGGEVLRLGRNSGRAFDVMNVANAYDEPERKFLALTDESGNIETLAEEIPVVDSSVNNRISDELDAKGVIYYKGTRPSADVLLEIHKRHPDISFNDFAVAVLRHCELRPTSSEGGGLEHRANGFRSETEKELWYSTPAGQAWIKDNPVPAIMKMRHTKEER